MDKPKEIPMCPVAGCKEQQCEPMILRVCDDHYPRIDGKTLRQWVIDLQDQLARAEQALAFYADIKNYNGVAGHPDQTPPIVFERGARARAALAAAEQPACATGRRWMGEGR